MKNADDKSKKERRGLYFALAVCLVAVGIAAWGTFNSVSDYVKVRTDGAGTLTRQQEDAQAPTQKPVATPQPEVSQAEEPEEPANTQPEESQPEAEPTAEPEQAEPETEDVDAPSYSVKESYGYPVSSHQVSVEFSGDKLVYNEVMRDHRTHDGVDMSAKNGETVYSANGGLVKKCYKDLLLGNVIIIEHGDYEFWYCGLGDTFLVKEGDVVTSSTAIGSVTQVPSEMGEPHLHLQVKKDGSFVNPTGMNFEQ